MMRASPHGMQFTVSSGTLAARALPLTTWGLKSMAWGWRREKIENAIDHDPDQVAYASGLPHKETMNAVYRYMKYVYDATRIFFLPGRRTIQRNLPIDAATRVLEVGCGTGYNLRKLAELHPECKFLGLDISSEMISFARSQMDKRGLSDRVSIVEGDVADMDRENADAAFDCVFFSYSLSMIPLWCDALEQAFSLLGADGELWIVDFGDFRFFPAPIRRFLFRRYAGMMHVHPRTTLHHTVHQMAAERKMNVECWVFWWRYAQLLRVKKSD
jgi:S-adenosylmethionine-diacylgycerolhomoserine-N-methlytransferase